MTPETVLSISQNALEVILMLLAMTLLPALIVGLLVSMFQAATQINEMTLSFIPKLFITILVLIIGGPWMLMKLIDYAQHLINSIPYLIG